MKELFTCTMFKQ